MTEANLESVDLTGVKPHPTTETPVEPAPAPAAAEPAVTDPAPAEGNEPVAADPAPPAEPDPKPRVVHNAFQSRIDKLTREKHDLAREKAALEIRLAQATQPAVADPAPIEPVPATPARPAAAPAPDVDTLINQRAQQLYQERLHQERVNSVLSAGNTEYKDFTDRCNVVANLGGADRPDFMQIVTDPSIVPDGHKIIAALAENPDDAARILSLPTVAMSAELARYAERVAKPAPKAPAISKVPAPIKPISGTATASDEPSSNDSEEEWYAKRQAQRAQRHQVARSL